MLSVRTKELRRDSGQTLSTKNSQLAASQKLSQNDRLILTVSESFATMGT